MADRPERAIAAIDCGTNSTRLLVVSGAGATLVRRMRITRLGQGVDASRKLDPESIERTLAVLGEFRETMDRLGVERVRMVATSAVRDATNGQDFLDAATELVGTRAELLAGEEEGALAFAGATADLPPTPGDVVVVDIGGGSTELIVGRHGRIDAASLELGCVRVTERCLGHDPPTRSDMAAATATIAEELDRAEAVLPALRTLRPASLLIGLAGTVSTLSALEQGLSDYHWDRIHHSVLSFDDVDKWCAALTGEPASTLARWPGMVPGREDVIAGGALILRQVMDRFGFDECLVSESDILDGLVASLRQ